MKKYAVGGVDEPVLSVWVLCWWSWHALMTHGQSFPSLLLPWFNVDSILRFCTIFWLFGWREFHRFYPSCIAMDGRRLALRYSHPANLVLTIRCISVFAIFHVHYCMTMGVNSVRRLICFFTKEIIKRVRWLILFVGLKSLFPSRVRRNFNYGKWSWRYQTLVTTYLNYTVTKLKSLTYDRRHDINLIYEIPLLSHIVTCTVPCQ